MSYEHGSDSERLLNCGYKVEMIGTDIKYDYRYASAELATAVTGLHSTKFPYVGLQKEIMYERKINRGEELLH
jgi:hypothetical protein